MNSANDLEPFVLTLKNLKRLDLAKEVLDTFGNIASSYEQYDNLAKCYFKLCFYDDAIVYGEKTMIHAGNSEQAYKSRCNLINLYNHANYPEKAMRYIKQCEYVIPADVDIILEKAYAHYLLNEKAEAERLLQDLLDNHTGLSEEYKATIKFNLGTYYMHRDNFQAGLKLFLDQGIDTRNIKTNPGFTRNKIQLGNTKHQLRGKKYIEWDGKPKPGLPLIVYAEAGIGDEIINIRFMKKIQEMGMTLYWYNPHNDRQSLLDMFRRHGYNVVSDLKNIVGDTVYFTSSMRLPLDMSLEYKDLWQGPYLKPDGKYVEKWSSIRRGRPTVGIRWRGNPEFEHDLHRSWPLAPVLDIFKNTDVDLYSLQKDYGLDEIDHRIHDLSGKLETWEDTLACIENLDYVITSCTSVAHAAAAMGKKTFIFVPISSYYVWSHSGDKSPWYGDNVILLRQEKPRSWDAPIEKLKAIIG